MQSLALGIDPDKLLLAMGHWLVNDGIALKEVKQRTDTIFSIARETRGALDMPTRTHPSIQALMLQWGPVYYPKRTRHPVRFETQGVWSSYYENMLDLRELLPLGRDTQTPPTYVVVPQIRIPISELNPNYKSRGTPHVHNGLLGNIDLTQEPATAVLLGIRDVRTRTLQESELFQDAPSSIVRGMRVEGLARKIPNPERQLLEQRRSVLLARLETLFQRYGGNLQRSDVNKNGAATFQFASASTLRAVENWPAELLKQRIDRWKFLFARATVRWYQRTRARKWDLLTQGGWVRLDASEDERAPGADVRTNAMALFEREVLIPRVHKVADLLDDIDYLSMDPTREEVRSWLFEYLDLQFLTYREPGTPAAAAPGANQARAKQLLLMVRAFAHLDLLEDFHQWLTLKRAPPGVRDPIRDQFQRNEQVLLEKLIPRATFVPSSDRAIFQTWDAYVESESLLDRKRILDSMAAKEVAKDFFVLLLDARHVTEKKPGRALRDFLSEQEIQRRGDPYRVGAPEKNPAYALLVRLVAFPDPQHVHAWVDMSDLEALRLRRALYEESDRETLTAIPVTQLHDVRAILDLYYKRQMRTALATPEQLKAAKSGGVPFRRWLARNQRTLGTGVKAHETSWVDLQRASYEFTRIVYTISNTIEYQLVPGETVYRRNTHAPLVLTVHVHDYPSGTNELHFLWKKNDSSATLVYSDVQGVGKHQAAYTSAYDLGKQPNAGTYFCVVEAWTVETRELLGQGESVRHSVIVVARCVRCRADYRVGEEDRSALLDETGAPVFSLTGPCTWTVHPRFFAENDREETRIPREHFDFEWLLTYMLETTLITRWPSDKNHRAFREGRNFDFQAIWNVLRDDVEDVESRSVVLFLRRNYVTENPHTAGGRRRTVAHFERHVPYAMLLSACSVFYQILHQRMTAVPAEHKKRTRSSLRARNREQNVPAEQADANREDLTLVEVESAQGVVSALQEKFSAFLLQREKTKARAFPSKRPPREQTQAYALVKRWSLEAAKRDNTAGPWSPEEKSMTPYILKQMVARGIFFDVQGYERATARVRSTQDIFGPEAPQFTGVHSDQSVLPDLMQAHTRTPSLGEVVGDLTLLPDPVRVWGWKPAQRALDFIFVQEISRKDIRSDWDLQIFPGSVRLNARPALEHIQRRVEGLYTKLKAIITDAYAEDQKDVRVRVRTLYEKLGDVLETYNKLLLQ